MDTPATIKIFLPFGDPKRLRTAELSNWSGKGVAAPRSDLEAFLSRDELAKPGIYVLTGRDPESEAPSAYVGEGERMRDRVRAHGGKDFWTHAYAFLSKDQNLTKAHIRHLEGRLIEEAEETGRFTLTNSQASGARLPESDRADMEVFLEKIRQLLPALGSDLLTPSPSSQARAIPTKRLYCEIKGLKAEGTRTPDGFLVFEGSEAVSELRPSTRGTGNFVERKRSELVNRGILEPDGDHLRFTDDFEFASPSGAASVIQGGNANGMTAWKDPVGRTLKELEEDPESNSDRQ